MESSRREQIRQRSHFCCEYCLLPEAATPIMPFHVEHIIAKQHMIDDSLDNLALACDRCNAFKGPNLSSIDPFTNKIVNLFNPRLDVWGEHFRFEGSVIRASLRDMEAGEIGQLFDASAADFRARNGLPNAK